MRTRRAFAAGLLMLLFAACSASPSPTPQGGSPEPSEGSVLDEARSVANDLEQPQIVIDEQMRDPFSPPSSSN